jgi:ComF family protein
MAQVLDVLFPPRCVGCGTRGAWFCAQCVQQTTAHRPVLPCPHGVAMMVCPHCLPELTALAGVRVAGRYQGALKEAIWALKFQGKRQSAGGLGQLLADVWQISPITAADGVVAVPTTGQRQRQRGYNQAALLAHACARTLHLPYIDGALLCARSVPPQVGLTAPERRANVRDLFVVRAQSIRAMQGKRLILVDDVMTTGATLDATAQALLRAGAAQVWGLVLARPTLRDR